MARIDLLVDGKKHRFVLSTASTDSVFPENLVPPGRMVQKEMTFLCSITGDAVKTSGFYQARLESPNVDFHVSLALTVGGCYPVLGTDFLQQAQVKVISADYLDVVNHKGAIVRLPLTIQDGPEEDGCILIPTVRRLPILVPQSQPTSVPENCGQPKRRTPVTARNVVFFHIETTGFGNDAEIIQIAASCRGNTFNVYILPDGDIHPKAAQRNGFAKSGGRLYLRGRAMVTTPRRQAVNDFLGFLGSAGGGGGLVLAAHNAGPFHAPILTRLFASLGLADQFESQVQGLADTLPLFRRALQGWDVTETSFSLEELVKKLLKEEVGLLVAEKTVAILEKLIKKVKISYKEIIQSAEPVMK